ncbi:MAG: hypothetical protein Q7R95_07425, partial [bacterium]|nr:hypothetical protein [bacterium]
FQDGSGRDIGAVVRNHNQVYEPDIGQYDDQKEVYAACAAACLYRKVIFDKLGGLNEEYFMYYEDVDISERARMIGYKIFYQPKAEVRHMHALSSKEWSPFFIYNVEKGRLLHTFFNFPFYVFINEYLKFLKQIFIMILWFVLTGRLYKISKAFILQGKNKTKNGSNPGKLNQYIQYLKVAGFFTVKFPILLIYRNQQNKMLSKDAIQNNYDSIVKGEWYF